MPVKTNAELDAYFNTGDQPSESNFQDLIDTIQPAAVTLTETQGTKALTIADHAFRTVIVPDLTGALTLTLPTSWTAEHDWFHILYFGDLGGDDTHNLLIKTGTQNSQFFHGGIIHTETDETTATSTSVERCNGSTNDILTLTTGEHAEFWIQAKSSTVWYIWGHSAGSANDLIACSDA